MGIFAEIKAVKTLKVLKKLAYQDVRCLQDDNINIGKLRQTLESQAYKLTCPGAGTFTSVKVHCSTWAQLILHDLCGLFSECWGEIYHHSATITKAKIKWKRENAHKITLSWRDGWMDGWFRFYGRFNIYHMSYQARLPMKGNELNGLNNHLNIDPGPEQTW